MIFMYIMYIFLYIYSILCIYFYIFCNSVANMSDLTIGFRFKRFSQESEIFYGKTQRAREHLFLVCYYSKLCN